MPNIAKINGIDEDDISHHNGGAAALYAYKNGDTWVHFVPMVATGGETDGTIDGDYKYHIFTDSGTFTVTTEGHGEVEYLVIAGGGGGASGFYGGGGGAGGYRTATGFSVSEASSPYTITVGGGGATVPVSGPTRPNALSGTPSSFSTITSTGGGYGSGYNTGNPGGDGGSGGGGCGTATARVGGSGNTPSTSPSQGNDGGSGTHPTGNSRGAGGGGAGAVGQDVSGNATGSTGGVGGVGLASSITGSSIYRGGGGGGGAYYTQTTVSAGGNGGGGAGAGHWITGASGVAGLDNYGGGGGGGNEAPVGATGGKGVVIIRYKFQ